jgi:hypothetical protein
MQIRVQMAVQLLPGFWMAYVLCRPGAFGYVQQQYFAISVQCLSCCGDAMTGAVKSCLSGNYVCMLCAVP